MALAEHLKSIGLPAEFVHSPLLEGAVRIMGRADHVIWICRTVDYRWFINHWPGDRHTIIDPALPDAIERVEQEVANWASTCANWP